MNLLGYLSKIRMLLPFLARARDVDWVGLIAAMRSGSWRTTVLGICAALLFVVCCVLNLFGIDIPPAVWSLVPTAAVTAVSVAAADAKAAAGAVPVSTDADPAAMVGPPVVRDPPPRTDKAEWPPKRI